MGSVLQALGTKLQLPVSDVTACTNLKAMRTKLPVQDLQACTDLQALGTKLLGLQQSPALMQATDAAAHAAGSASQHTPGPLIDM
eukprot:362251-Chlamydomonas_euryale.AAC.7